MKVKSTPFELPTYMTSASPRLLLIDENVRDTGGHYLELATLLMDGARALGFTPTLATNQAFSPPIDSQPIDTQPIGSRRMSEPYNYLPTFRSRRLNQWSLGVDGRSFTKRDENGKPIGKDLLGRIWHQVRDPLSRRERRPNVMIREWSADFVRLLHRFQPSPSDSVVINTADDFVMLALANGLTQYKSELPLQIRAVFHFAVFESENITTRAVQFGEQVNACVRAMAPHDITLHATTQSLSDQLSRVGVNANPVPYPTRSRPIAGWEADKEPLKIVMAGMPRAEKGREQIPLFLSLIHDPYLTSGQFRVSMQMRPAGWQRLIPDTLHADYAVAVDEHREEDGGPARGALEIVSSDLPGEEYHHWLGTADVGLFLYDPVRYVARCSGVLLEMFIGGVPVIVPEHCWLADQVNAAGGNGAIGYIYRSIEEIPSLLREIKNDYAGLRTRASEFAKTIAARHAGENTLHQMGIPNVAYLQRRAS